MSRTSTAARKAERTAKAAEKKAHKAVHKAAGRTEDLVESADKAVRPKVDAAVAWASPHVHTAKGHVVHAKDWAEPHVVHAKEWAEPRLKQAADATVTYAAPKVEAAAGRIAPAVDTARDTIVDGWLPKVVDTVGGAAAAAAAAKATAGERGHDAVEVLRGRATAAPVKARRRGRKVWWVLGILGALGAVAAVLLRRQDDASDPWAQPYPTYPPAPVPATGPSEQPATGGSDDADLEDDEEQKPETDIADIAPGEHTVTDDGAAERERP